MPDRQKGAWSPWLVPLAVASVLSLASCCPAPAGAGSAPAGFAGTVADVDAAGFWVGARDGGRWRVAGAPPAPVGERVYLEGVWTATGDVRVDRVTPLTDSPP